MRLDVFESLTGTEFVFTADSELEEPKLARFAELTRGGSRISATHVSARSVILQRESVLRRTAELLRKAGENRVSVADLAAQLQVPAQRVRTALSTLKDHGLAERWHRGCWSWKGRR